MLITLQIIMMILAFAVGYSLRAVQHPIEDAAPKRDSRGRFVKRKKR